DEAVIGSGTTSVVNGQLGTLDPTVLINGFYTLRLEVTNVFGKLNGPPPPPQSDRAVVDSLQIRGDQKVGVFALLFTDLVVPLPGISLSVNRSYDTREKRSLDFGFGWTLSLSNVDVEKDGGHNVILTLPDGHREPFIFNPRFPPGDPFGVSGFFVVHFDP